MFFLFLLLPLDVVASNFGESCLLVMIASIAMGSSFSSFEEKSKTARFSGGDLSLFFLEDKLPLLVLTVAEGGGLSTSQSVDQGVVGTVLLFFTFGPSSEDELRA